MPNKQMFSEESSMAKSDIWQDERFHHLVADPRFKSLPKQQRKVKIDKRFQGMFTNDKFKVKYTVDKYGRRVNKSNAEDLKKYYELNSSADDSEDEERNELKIKDSDDEESGKSSSELEENEEREKEEKAILQERNSVDDLDENDALISDGEYVPTSLRDKLTNPNIDYARGEGRLITDSSSDESSEEEDPELYIDHVWGELANDAETTEESTKRLAVCNMDWDRVRAVDLMVLFSSFLPPGGSVLSVKIYPSEFGKERLKEEELHGPPELVGLDNKTLNKLGCLKKQSEDDISEICDSEDELVQEQDSDAGEGDDYHMEKLRQYQLNRLRYYYAVVECDSVATADKIYKECDGIEYESSATKVDLRFIPENTSFEEDEPSDVCNDLPDSNSYQPRQFTNTALQQAKVDLTWDETALERKELGDKLSSCKMDGISDNDLRKIVAYSSEEEQEEEEEENHTSETEIVMENKIAKIKADKISKKERLHPEKRLKKNEVINKYRALLAEINEKEEKEKQKKQYEMEFSWDIENKKSNPFKDDEHVESNKNPSAELTPIEKVLKKRSEKNKKRKEERKKRLQTNGEGYESEIDSIPDDIDMNDPYFAEEFANGDFEDPNSKRKEKQKKNQLIKAVQEEEEGKQAQELQLLLDDNAEEDGKQHFSLEKILKIEQETKTKKKRKKQLKKSKTAVVESEKPIEDNFELNINDQRFKAVFTSHDFNIDPTDSHYKKTKAMEQLIQEKLKRRHGVEKLHTSRDDLEEEVVKKTKLRIENTMLVKNLKRKIQIKQQGK